MTHGALMAHLMFPLMFYHFIGVGLRVLFPLRLHRALCLLQFYFSRASANFSFKGIIGDPMINFKFSVIFYNSNLICITFFVLFSVTLFVEYFWVIKFFLLFEDAIVIFRWRSGVDAAGGLFPGLGISH